MRVDLALKRLCLTRSRTEGKAACDVGAVWVNGVAVRASATVGPGDRLRVDYAQRTLEVELLAEVPGNVSRAAARALYRVLRDERAS